MQKTKKLVAFVAIVAGLFGAGIAYASWTATGGGSGYAKAGSAVDLSTAPVAASTTSQLYPMNSADVKITITNPNPYGVDVQSINNAATGSILSGDSVCDASNGVTFANQSGTWHVNANSSATFTLANAATMSNASVDACQGETFTIPVALAGISAPPNS